MPTPLRKPSAAEIELLTALLEPKPETTGLLASLGDLLVGEMADGGMGSRLLVPKDTEGDGRRFGQEVVVAEYTDADGVPVSITINLDKEGRLYELDLWKVDFGALVAWPKPKQIRVISDRTISLKMHETTEQDASDFG